MMRSRLERSSAGARMLLVACASLCAVSSAMSTLPKPSVVPRARGAVAASSSAAAAVARHPAIAEHAEYDALRGEFERAKLVSFFSARPLVVAKRLATVASTLNRVRDVWLAEDSLPLSERTRGAALVSALSSLGPVAVKIGQTLSQRPDICGVEACVALKALQTSNKPFADEVAIAIVKEQLGFVGPIAPWEDTNEGGSHEGVKPLFRQFSRSPVASASLGQVYRATTREGADVAVKVQRPEAMRVLGVDYICFLLVWKVIELKWSMSSSSFEFDLSAVVDRVAGDIYEELDYRKEAANSVKFRESLSFLGFVDTVECVPAYTTAQVLTTEWIRGQHLSALTQRDGLRMTRMAVEACTASLVLTGYVHADPHEGNLMLADDGKVVFLDFGLMSTVEPFVMEAFATGIQACLSEDYETLAKVFADVGFLILDPETQTPLWRPSKGLAYTAAGVLWPGEDGLKRFTAELTEAMRSVEGAQTRFGALSTVLNQVLAPTWKMFTPPYILLLIRTFLTLEGIAAEVEPEFNIYSVSLPWALRRSLAPSSPAGKAALRATLLDDENRVRWTRLLELVQADAKEPPAAAKPRAAGDAEESDTAMSEAINSVLGAPAGSALRKALADLDSIDLSRRLSSRDARPLRRAAANAAGATLAKQWAQRKHSSVPALRDTAAHAKREGSQQQRPSSPLAKATRLRQARWKQTVLKTLFRIHLKRQLKAGWRGAVSLATLLAVALRVAAGAARVALSGRQTGSQEDVSLA